MESKWAPAPGSQARAKIWGLCQGLPLTQAGCNQSMMGVAPPKKKGRLLLWGLKNKAKSRGQGLLS